MCNAILGLKRSFTGPERSNVGLKRSFEGLKAGSSKITNSFLKFLLGMDNFKTLFVDRLGCNWFLWISGGVG